MTGRSIVVVGGGFAGWLAALALERWASRSEARPSIVLVEAPSIATIGVGESATGLLTTFLERHGITAARFAREARATLKLGLELVGWTGAASVYRAPIDNPDRMAGIDGATSVSQRCAVADGFGVDTAHLHGWLMAREKVPALAAGSGIELLGSHAWHFDARAAAKCVEDAAVQRGVRAVHGAVTTLEHGVDGGVRALRLADGRRVAGDFFIDCTGQRRLFMDKRAADWTPQAHVIRVNRAVAGFAPHRRAIPVATRAIAAPAGWIWEIPTADRLGVGYVHDGASIDLDSAWETLRRHAGEGFAAGPVLRFEPGYRREPWRGNAVAIGMAAGFTEPLQSSSLHIALVQIDWLVRSLDAAFGKPRSWDSEARRFNAVMRLYQQDVAEFIALHYSRGAFRNPFWTGAAEAARSTALFRSCFGGGGFPADRALQGRSGGISPNLVLPVAGGLGFLGRVSAAATVTAEQRAAARKARAMHRRYCAEALGHESALRFLGSEADALADRRPAHSEIRVLASEGAV